MTPSEIQRVREDLHERGYPADDWTDAEIELLPVWRWAHGQVFATLRKESEVLGDLDPLYLNAWRQKEPSTGTDCETLIEAINHVENNRPCNRLAIMHLLEQEAAKQ